MTRREFLGLTMVGTASLVLPATARTRESFFTAPANLHLLGFLHHEQVVGDIGRRYREMAPEENNEQVLVEAILPQQSGAVSAALSAQLHQQVTQDFASGRTVKVNGWILSMTEARQCALYSLQQD